MFTKLKFILFSFLVLTLGLGIVFSLTSFSSFNSNLSVSSTSSKVRKKRQVLSSSTEVEWNAHMTKIKPVLKNLAELNKPEIRFTIDESETEYQVTNLIKLGNINAQYHIMSLEAQKELRLLYANGIDDAKLTAVYKSELDAFFLPIKSPLQEFATAKITEVTIDGTPLLNWFLNC